LPRCIICRLILFPAKTRIITGTDFYNCMKQKNNNRRQFVKTAALGLGVLGLPALGKSNNPDQTNRKRILCVGGHPDDPETGCGGTLALLAAAGHTVKIAYLTSGQAGIPGKSHDAAGEIRTLEAKKACEILKAEPLFMGQVDGDSIFNNAWVEKFDALFKDFKPELIFTHWPIDSHKDHQVASLLTIQAWKRSGEIGEMYFFEVDTGYQSVGFKPTDYIDITATREQKRLAVFCHVSQKPDAIYTLAHTAMENFRGLEIGVSAAEGFVRLQGKKTGLSALL